MAYDGRRLPPPGEKEDANVDGMRCGFPDRAESTMKIEMAGLVRLVRESVRWHAGATRGARRKRRFPRLNGAAAARVNGSNGKIIAGVRREDKRKGSAPAILILKLDESRGFSSFRN